MIAMFRTLSTQIMFYEVKNFLINFAPGIGAPIDSQAST